jgi:hypothetical protein
MFKGLYISSDASIIEKTKRTTEDDFKQILGGNCYIYSIGNHYKIIYNKHSEEENQFLNSIVYHTNIFGPIIIYNDNKGEKCSLNTIRDTLKNNINNRYFLLDGSKLY